ncbi:hypothetical protein [Nonomuraea diastatica]|uniref:hypothetical protein n=1 Tax=Nonomuraea diastatica TaxID=1848329 RepID=UPI001FE24E91|nr:hypothetical protein [Nonomuraea diastatica]
MTTSLPYRARMSAMTMDKWDSVPCHMRISLHATGVVVLRAQISARRREETSAPSMPSEAGGGVGRLPGGDGRGGA